MNEWTAFDLKLVDSMDDLPPSAEDMAAVTPWREAMYRILWGLVLTTIHLEVLYLQYIFPALGSSLLYLGFRSLRSTNNWFRLGWYASICKAIIFYSNSLLLATPFSFAPPAFWTAAVYITTPVLYLSLWLGLRQAAATVGYPTTRQPALWALLWYLALTVIAVYAPHPALPLALLILILYLCIIHSLWRATKDLENWGYDVTPVIPKISSGKIQGFYLGSLSVLIVLFTLVSNHIPTDFHPTEESLPLSALTELGFPEDAASQLLPEDLESLTGAVRCDMLDKDHPLYGSDGNNEHQNQIYSLLMPDGSLRIVHLFVPDDTHGFWQCRIKLTANARLYDATARLFYTKDGRRMTTTLPFADSTMVSGTDPFFGSYFEQHTTLSPVFSWPLFSKERMAYAIYSADQEANPKTMFDQYVHYGADIFPVYPFLQNDPKYHWSGGTSFYYGNGSGLVYKADEAARNETGLS